MSQETFGSLAADVDLMSQPGCYSLVISLKRKKILRVGNLGAALFPKGTYVYTGSAMNGLAARLARHLRREKRIHWHIDYLLKLPEARVEKILTYPPAADAECRQNQRIAALPGAAVVLKRFGATDCRSGCESHLYFFAARCRIQAPPNALWRRLLKTPNVSNVVPAEAGIELNTNFRNSTLA